MKSVELMKSVVGLQSVVRHRASFSPLIAACLIGFLIASGVPGRVSAGDPGIRQPTGEVNAFWHGFAWFDLTPDEQALWTVLGWDPASWTGKSPAPASQRMKWSALPTMDRLVAEKLGFDASSWDSGRSAP
ncbi:hypothetical protein ThidrDRAFT_2220 [Thiorhodococcus drewsii AZ1]|uniref:Uncharacterized protein n=1 Tax=Thiorhodococcus drewsii AZ1 TaxID=765913 RepID=G2E1Q7_9GAMM|nr:hypothetical protein [Thiorhodococcus drewsii]EGV31115.1 hypothetical protein ThidrDRAFT_2220 [Thiorhodococcus drewsii AZ1]